MAGNLPLLAKPNLREGRGDFPLDQGLLAFCVVTQPQTPESATVQSPMDIICFANGGLRIRSLEKQIMLRLAQRHRILWINSINNRRPRIAQKDFLRSLQKLRDFRRGLTQVDKRI